MAAMPVLLLFPFRKNVSAESRPLRVSVRLVPTTIPSSLRAEKPWPNLPLQPPRRGRRRGPHSARIGGLRLGPLLLSPSRVPLRLSPGLVSVQPCHRRSQPGPSPPPPHWRD